MYYEMYKLFIYNRFKTAFVKNLSCKYLENHLLYTNTIYKIFSPVMLNKKIQQNNLLDGMITMQNIFIVFRRIVEISVIPPSEKLENLRDPQRLKTSRKVLQK